MSKSSDHSIKCSSQIIAYAALGLSLLGLGLEVGSYHAANNPETVRRILIQHPDILVDAGNSLQTFKRNQHMKEMEDRALTYKSELLDSHHSGVLGNPDGHKIVVVFFDYQCHFCRDSESGLTHLLQDKDVKIILREVPFISPTSLLLEKIALASVKTGQYKAVHDALMALPLPYTQESLHEALVRSGVDVDTLEKEAGLDIYTKYLMSNMTLAQNIGVTGTPSFVIPGGKVFQGFPGVDAINQAFIDVNNHNFKE